MVAERKNIILQSLHHRPFLADVFWLDNQTPKPVILFCHGFKGFKDWGAYDLVARYFAQQGFVFVKFNFSHNGTTIDNPYEFTDLEAFGNNNMSKELDDAGVVIDWICGGKFDPGMQNTNPSQIYIMGHSRGGGIAILKAREDNRVRKVAVWASVNEYGKYWKNDEMERIRRDGVIYVPNTRTGQQMPVYWQLYENYYANLHRLYIPDAVKNLKVPLLIVHGTDDETVPVSNALEMHRWNKESILYLIEGSNHNFGARHPWQQPVLPADLQKACEATVNFLRQQK
ncbi:MAG: prolyl oligopeptidase family serine peptidase [Chitinophagales bacterium]|nr:prolyl oligopeptidase family serine peptidase [Chitinophagales bacterium]MDW8417851.1 prolyl oligopeptidase family serine peptidase [Chitinophagales bacterium]